MGSDRMTREAWIQELAEFIIHGSDGKQVFTRAQIKVRIEKVLHRIAEKVEQQKASQRFGPRQ